jgi:hypothetical protein
MMHLSCPPLLLSLKEGGGSRSVHLFRLLLLMTSEQQVTSMDMK